MEGVITVAGFSFAGRGQNMGLAFVRLKDWNVRQTPDLKAPAIAGRAMKAFSQIQRRPGLRLFATGGAGTGGRPTASTSSCRIVADWGMRS